MKSNDFRMIEQLLELNFQKRQKVFLKVLSEEGRLRESINKLDTQVGESERSNLEQVRAIGADVLWKSWVERTKRGINMELAQVLAQKDQLKRKVAKEYGKVLVSRDLTKLHEKYEREHIRARTLDKAIEAYLVQNQVAAKGRK